jgi:hypothetical protein
MKPPSDLTGPENVVCDMVLPLTKGFAPESS